MFVDRVTIEVIGGRGGDGCMSMRREKYVPRGGPDGGNGGHGGSVILIAQHGVNSLAGLSFQHFWRAGEGTRGSGSSKTGRGGEDLIVPVPVGTVVYDANEGFILKDLAKEGDQVIAAQGGKGGYGNEHFKSSTNRAPKETTPGGEGERRKLTLELKVIADVGLIGMPNAGKSTLLSRLSHARPEIADYPFTTKYPNLGQVIVEGDRAFVLADIPGLIEGAHRGVGLGHEFLRHVERAGILVHLVEPCPMDESDPIQNYRAIRSELAQYAHGLAERVEIPVITKAELPGAAEIRDRLAAETGHEVSLISAVTGQGLPQLVRRVAQQLWKEAE